MALNPLPPARVECPACHSSFTLEHLGIPSKAGVVATVLCVCGHQLDVTLRPPPRKVLGVRLGRKEIHVRLSADLSAQNPLHQSDRTRRK